MNVLTLHPHRRDGRRTAIVARRIFVAACVAVALVILASVWWSLEAYLQDREAAAFFAVLSLLPVIGPLVRLGSLTHRVPPLASSRHTARDA